MEKISFVIPCYRSEGTIGDVINEIRNVMQSKDKYEYEIILVNDYSPDNVWEVIQKYAETDECIIGVNLAKNFGQHATLMAGYHYATGDIVISMDDDLQTPADEVFKLIDKIHEGYDVVYSKYKQNMENPFRRFGSRVNSLMAQYMIGKPRDISIQSYYAAKRYIISEIIKYEHSYPYIFGLVFRTTRRIANVEINHRIREKGSSGYNLKKLLQLWMNGFTAFSVKPLRIATFVGIICALVGFIFVILTIIGKLVHPEIAMGYSSTMAVLLFIGGMLMLMLGIIGEYIGRIYICINKSPQYVVESTVNLKQDKDK